MPFITIFADMNMTGFIGMVVMISIAFVAIVGYEAWQSYRKNIRIYTLADSLVNIYCGMLERVFDVFYAVLFLMASNHLYENWAPYKLEPGILTWVLGLFLFDFFAYWFHRLSHEINFLWAAHIVHHQSEELNFTTVFRVSFFAVIFRSAFFIWMPLMGFDPFTIFTLGVFLAGYQFLTHSRIIGKLGILEFFMTTPSHHRVHHGRNAKYMDHNYGHIFIIWDRMFGTFVPEEEEPEYGITSGFESNNPYWAQFSYWRDLIVRSAKAKRLLDKVNVFIKGPAWTPEDVGFLPYEYYKDTNGERIKRDVRVSPELATYALINTAITIAAFAGLMWVAKTAETGGLMALLSNPQVIALVITLLISVYAHGRLLEGRKDAILADLIRLCTYPFTVWMFFHEHAFAQWLLPLAIVMNVIMAIWLLRLSFFVREPLVLVSGEVHGVRTAG